MRTARALNVSPSMLCGGGWWCLPPGGCLLTVGSALGGGVSAPRGGVCFRRVSAPRGRCLLPQGVCSQGEVSASGEGGVCFSGSVCSWGVSASRWCLLLGGYLLLGGGSVASQHALRQTPPPCEQNHTCLWKHNLAPTSLRAVIMCTACFSDSGVSLQRPFLDRDPWTETLRKEHGTRDRDPLRRNMGPGSQTGSDIIQRPPSVVDRMTDTSENITLLQTSCVGGKKWGARENSVYASILRQELIFTVYLEIKLLDWIWWRDKVKGSFIINNAIQTYLRRYEWVIFDLIDQSANINRNWKQKRKYLFWRNCKTKWSKVKKFVYRLNLLKKHKVHYKCANHLSYFQGFARFGVFQFSNSIFSCRWCIPKDTKTQFMSVTWHDSCVAFPAVVLLWKNNSIEQRKEYLF